MPLSICPGLTLGLFKIRRYAPTVRAKPPQAPTNQVQRTMFFQGIGADNAATGVLPAIVGATLQEVIDVIAILNSLRAGRAFRRA